MVIVVMVEGMQVKAKRISSNKLVKEWKTLSSKAMPKIKAFRISDEDFNSIVKQRHCFEDDMREIEEWGRLLSTRGTDACVFNASENEDAQYIILVRENPFHPMDKIILHELSHIARGDL